jgi:hypothetical protein
MKISGQPNCRGSKASCFAPESGGGLPNNLYTLPELQDEGNSEGKEDSNADGGQNARGAKNSGDQCWWRRGQVEDQKMVEQ